MVWARRIQALAQSGLAFQPGVYDRERYEALRELAAEIMAVGSGADPRRIATLFAEQTGYATPKVDVRGAVFDDHGRLLLVRETADAGRWTLPGGWADVNQTPAESVVREVWEEAGLRVAATKLLAVYDRARHPHEPPYPFHIYKLVFRCAMDGDPAAARGDGHETSEAAFFARDELPLDGLSTSRTLPFQILRAFDHHRDPSLPTDFD